MEIIYGKEHAEQANRIKENKILYIRRIDKNGITFAWDVKLKCYGDLYVFTNKDSRRRQTFTEYPFEDLPEAIKSFFNKSKPKLLTAGKDITEYIYRI